MLRKCTLCCCILISVYVDEPSYAQPVTGAKKISTDLSGLFFEDINYAADGGLYAELIQNRSFEYRPADNRQWNSFSYWEYITPGFSYSSFNIETNAIKSGLPDVEIQPSGGFVITNK